MNIQGFSQFSLGNWFVQSTCHPLGGFASAAQSADLRIEPVALTDRAVIQLCEAVQADPAQVLTATQLHWQGQGLQPQPLDQGSRLLVSISPQPSGQQGQLLGQEPEGDIYQLEFYLDQEERLILTQHQGIITREDWLWFASPNLRLRFSLITEAGKLQQVTWYSEIRRSASLVDV